MSQELFREYPDVVKIKQMCEMLGGIGIGLAYRLLQDKKIESTRVGREYRILKTSIIRYLKSCR